MGQFEGSRQKSLISNTIVLALGQFVPQLTALITLPIYTGMLTRAEYGRYDMINMIVYILNVVVVVQIHQAVFRYLIDVRNSDREDVYITNTYLFELVPSAVTAVLFGLAYRGLPIGTRVLIGLYLFFVIQYHVSGQVARGLGNNRVYALGSIANAVSNMTLVVLLVSGAKLGFQGLFLSLNTAYALGTMIQIFLCGQHRKIHPRLLDRKVIGEMLRYSWPMVPNTLSIWIVNTCDKFIIRYVMGIEYNGIFAVAQKIPSIFSLAYSTFNMAWQESAAVTVKDQDHNAYYNEIFDALFRFLSGSILLLIAATPVLFALLIHDQYDQAYRQIPLLYIGVYLSSFSSFFGSIYIAKKASRAVGVSSMIGAAINCIVNLAMISWAGLYAASVSTIVSYLVLVLYRVADLERKGYAHIHYRLPQIAGYLGVIVLASVLCFQRRLLLDACNLTVGAVLFVFWNRKLLRMVCEKVLKKRRK